MMLMLMLMIVLMLMMVLIKLLKLKYHLKIGILLEKVSSIKRINITIISIIIINVSMYTENQHHYCHISTHQHQQHPQHPQYLINYQHVVSPLPLLPKMNQYVSYVDNKQLHLSSNNAYM